MERLLAPAPGARARFWPEATCCGTSSDGRTSPRRRERRSASRRLARTFELTPLDIELLLVTLAPDLDPRFERLYGYLHDDVGRRRATVGLALEPSGQDEWMLAVALRVSAGSALLEGGLLVVEEADRPFRPRSLRVPDRVTMHVLGDDRVDAAVAPLVAAGVPPSAAIP